MREWVFQIDIKVIQQKRESGGNERERRKERKSLSDKGKEKCSIWSSLWFLHWKGLACPSSGAVNREGN